MRKSSDKDKKSAEQEAQILRSLKHPNIVSYKESFQTDGYLHIVMLYCEGGDLYSKIKQQNGRLIEETQIVEWFVQITMALQVDLNSIFFFLKFKKKSTCMKKIFFIETSRLRTFF